MMSWHQLDHVAARLDTEITTARGTEASIVDSSDGSPLVTISIGTGLRPLDRDRVLRASIKAPLAEMRRRGA